MAGGILAPLRGVFATLCGEARGFCPYQSWGAWGGGGVGCAGCGGPVAAQPPHCGGVLRAAVLVEGSGLASVVCTLLPCTTGVVVVAPKAEGGVGRLC